MHERSAVTTLAPLLDILEDGDTFSSIGPVGTTTKVHDCGDVHRFYMVLAARRPTKIYRPPSSGGRRVPEKEADAQSVLGENNNMENDNECKCQWTRG
jgi:hypothetical protein